jgi:hypothetical protein
MITSSTIAVVAEVCADATAVGQTGGTTNAVDASLTRGTGIATPATVFGVVVSINADVATTGLT